MSDEPEGEEEVKAPKVKPSSLLPEEAETKLTRLGELANILDYWRNEPSSLLFANINRLDQIVKVTTENYRKVLDGWSTLQEKIQKVRSAPKISKALTDLTKLTSSKNPWRLASLSMGFVAFAVLILAMSVLPQDWFLPVVIVSFVGLFGLQFYSTARLRKLISRNINLIQSTGGTLIEDLSETCKDLTQTIINTLTHELPKYGKGSGAYTMRLISNDYANVKLRVQEKVKKRGRRTGDLYAVIWR